MIRRGLLTPAGLRRLGKGGKKTRSNGRTEILRKVEKDKTKKEKKGQKPQIGDFPGKEGGSGRSGERSGSVEGVLIIRTRPRKDNRRENIWEVGVHKDESTERIF